MTWWKQRLSIQALKMPKKYRFSVFACILIVLILMFGSGNYNAGSVAYAEEGFTPTHLPTPIELTFAKPSSTGPFPAEGQPWTLSGWFNIVWGDGPEGVSEALYMLTDDSGQIVPLLLDETLSQSVGGVLWLDRKKVSVAGVWATSLSESGAATGLNVTSISLAPSPETGALSDDVSPAVIVSKPWVTIMCKFNDMAVEPKNLAYFTGMYANTKPGLDHYWRELSYDTANVAGSNAYGWFELPHPEAYYNPTDTLGGADLNLLATDCTGAANASVNFALYQTGGINMMFNSDFDNGYAWGGSKYMNIDGVAQVWSTTWEPPWAYADISVIQHEMGHGFGLPHSSGAYGATYDNAWDVMSKDRYNCAMATDPTYGCIAQHTISYHKDILGWIPAGQKFTATLGSSTTITLEQLALPATANYKMAQISIGGSSTHFYTVEARRLTGYDFKLAGEAVIIHEVDTTRSRPAYVIDPDLNGVTSDAGAMWVVGETFVDAANNISVRVDSATATGFQVTLVNGIASPTVTITANDPTATEAGLTTGQFTVTRTGATTSALTVYYGVSGTATYGSDYNSIGTSVTIPAGSSTATITVTPINDTAIESDETAVVTLSSNAAYTVGSPSSATVTITSDDTAGMSLGDAVDNTSLTWTTGGNANWAGQTAISYYGGDAAQSGTITHSQSTWVQTTVSGPGTLSYYWKASSESGYDYLRFYIDGVEQSGKISGEVNWTLKTYSISSGSHTLKWAYTKDGSISSGSDKGWLDKVEFR